MEIRDLKEYELIEERDVSDLNSKGYLLRHIKSGARLMLLSNDDENKVFAIGFRTPPKDSTGVPHILEHSVLCGSAKFPAKDPFVELAKGSLNTFLNAMTYPDKTVYPVASCNDKDFQNLMDVYMDSVFNPNIYKREEIFKQEGWHYELEAEDKDIEISGVVYGEMQGAFSSPEGSLEREILNSLFPDTTYAFESGGDPDDIPKLTYKDFLDFHKHYYHPVNSYIYLYGNMDMAEKLSWLDKEYLSKYDVISIDSEIGFQKPFESMKDIELEYSISSDESEENNTFLSYNKVVGTSLDKELTIAFQILEYALMSPGAPLKQALIDAGIGKDVNSSYDGGIKQPMFSIIAKNSNPDKKQEFLDIIEKVLKDQVKNGINKKSLLAGINVFEFKFREADFGPYPKGLMYGLQSFDSWLYDEKAPFLHLESNEVFAALRKKMDDGYFESLIEKYLLNNNHGTILTYLPKKGLTAKKEEALAKKLKDYKASLSKDEIKKLVEDTEALKKYQSEPSTKEELESIPMLKREDLKKEATPFDNTIHTVGETKVVHHDFFTNGIGYLTLHFNCNNISGEMLPYLGILKAVLGSVNTKNYSYLELNNDININSGGIFPDMAIYTNVANPDEYMVSMGFRARVLYDKLGFAFDIIKEIITTSDLDDYKRLKEIVAESRARIQAAYNTAGHALAMVRGMSYFSKTSRFSDITSGIDFYNLISAIDEDFDGHKEYLSNMLKNLVKAVFTAENLTVGYSSDKKGYEPLEGLVKTFKEGLFEGGTDYGGFDLDCVRKNEGFKTAAKIQYVSRSGNYRTAGYSYKGTLLVLKTILGYDYLWNNVRVMGGAYGCMSGFSRNGDTYFVSYRDPNLAKTNEIFEGIPEYVANFDIDERGMTKFIIGTISSIDTPLTFSARGSRSMVAYFTNLTYDYIQKSRDSILSATVEDIRELAPLMKEVLSQNNICVLGNEENLEAEKDMFDKLISLH
ncbi:MAG: insulinase family protein [Lachnospiraceae bacterium]|nr:insulinase family protein [Lachnospiraceae bacterium]